MYLNKNRLFNIDSLVNHLDLECLELNENFIKNISILKRFTQNNYLRVNHNSMEIIDDRFFSLLDTYEEIDFSFNKIKAINSMTKFVESVHLNNNELDDITFLNVTYNQVGYLNISNNNILNIQLIFKFSKLITLDISNNPIENFDLNKINLPDNLIYIFLSNKSLSLFDKLINKRKHKNRKMFNVPLFLILTDNVEFCDCEIILDYAKRNIFLNLFYFHQLDRFLTKCHLMELDYEL